MSENTVFENGENKIAYTLGCEKTGPIHFE